MQKGPELGELSAHGFGEGHQRPAQGAHVLGGANRQRVRPAACLLQHVLDHGADHPAHGLQAQKPVVQVRVLGPHLCDERADQGHVGDVGEAEQARLQSVVHVVVVVGDVVGQGRDLGLRRGPGVEAQVDVGGVFGDRPPRRLAQAVGHRPIVLDHAFQGLPGQVQAVEFGVAALQLGHQAKGLDVVVEPPERLHARAQLFLARMGERRMAEIMGEGDCLCEVRVQAQRVGDGAGDLGDFQGVGEAGAEVVAFVGHEDLRLFLEPAERGGVDDPVAVARERGPGSARRLGVLAAARTRRILSIGGQWVHLFRAGSAGASFAYAVAIAYRYGPRCSHRVTSPP